MDDVSRNNLHPDRAYTVVPEDLGLTPEPFDVPVPGAVLRGWFFRAPNAPGTLLVCGGNSSNMQLLLPIARAAVDAGFNAALFDYRGFGVSGGEPDVETIVPDAVAVLEAVRARPGAGKIALYGISLGSVVAVGAARERPEMVDAIVVEALFSPYEQLKKEMGGAAAFLGRALVFPGAWSVESYVAGLPQPMLLVHGDRDGILPIEDSLPIYEELAESAGLRWLWVPEGAGHAPGVAARFGPDYDALVTRFLERWLTGIESPWFAAAWEGGEVRLMPDRAPAVPIPVQVSAIASDGTPRVVRAWYDPARPAPVPLPLDAPPAFVSAVVVPGPVERDGDGWVRTGRYVRSYAAWRAFDDGLEEALMKPFRDWSLPHDIQEGLIRFFEQTWKKDGRKESVREWLRSHGLLTDETPEGAKRRAAAAAACAAADDGLRRLLAGDVHPDVRPRYAAAARRIWECLDALGGIEEVARARRLRLLELDLLPAAPEVRLEFGDASWRLGADPFDIPALLDRLAAADESYRTAAEEFSARAKARKTFLEEWDARNRVR